MTNMYMDECECVSKRPGPKDIMKNYQSTIQPEVTDMKKAVEFLADRFDSFTQDLDKVKGDTKEIQGKVEELEKEKEYLRQEVHGLQQYSQRENVLISGIPETPNKDLHEILRRIAEVIEYNFSANDVSVVRKIPSKNKEKISSIVVRFVRRTARETRQRHYKERTKRDNGGPGLSLLLLDTNMQDGRFYSGEHLTAYTSYLLKETKNYACNNGYKFVWVKDGKVYTRKNESSRVFKILCQ
ncbi:hypothetical protein C0J52_19521 [Blattella germanica]|nr:hypothetical protein C0J52_19521 [Blattella germanica]